MSESSGRLVGELGWRESAAALWRMRLVDPTVVATTLGAVALDGATTATPYTSAALRWPSRPAVIDEFGTISYRELDERTRRVAAALDARHIDDTDTVGILCRNHRGFVESNVAIARLGARPVYLNTGFAGPQLAEVVAREAVDLILHDVEFQEMVSALPTDLGIDAIAVDPGADGWSFPGLSDPGPVPRRPKWKRAAPTVLLTSGTTGSPKGAIRNLSDTSGTAAVSALSAIPIRSGDVFVVAAPLFHALGLAEHLAAAAAGGTIVLHSRFDPTRTLADIAAHSADVLVVVPVMLQRMLEACPDGDAAVKATLRIVASSGSALPAGLATRWMDAFGDNLYNMYGSTEVGQVTIAGPEDLRADPATSGRPFGGITVAILDDENLPVAGGEVGRIFVGSGALFSGYTSGDTKQIVDGMMATGDVGYIDPSDRLRVMGRDDDMIVSGGENVYPKEVEDLLATLDGITDVAVIGVDDEEFGQALAAFVVTRADTDLDEEAVKAHVRAHLARFKVPRRVEFLDDLPRSPTGKIVRRELRDL